MMGQGPDIVGKMCMLHSGADTFHTLAVNRHTQIVPLVASTTKGNEVHWKIAQGEIEPPE